MSPARTLENRLILACARVQPDFESIDLLVRRSPDWQEVLRKTERWALAPLVDAGLKQEILAGHVPAAAAEQLRLICQREANRGEAQLTALGGILVKFAEAGLPVIVLKDAALAALVYPSPALKTIGNLEFLIRIRDRRKVHELLQDLGYTRTSEAPPEAGGDEAEKAQLLYAGEGLPTIELHDEILRPWKTRLRVPVEDFWQRAQAVQIASVETHSFSREDMLLHLALHLAREERFYGRVGTLCDIRELCGRYWIDWAHLLSLAKSYYMGKYLYLALRLSRDLAGAGIPAFALKGLRNGLLELPLEGRFIAAVTRDEILADEGPRSRARKFLHELSLDLLSASHAGDEILPVSRRLVRWSRKPLWKVVYRRGDPPVFSLKQSMKEDGKPDHST